MAAALAPSVAKVSPSISGIYRVLVSAMHTGVSVQATSNIRALVRVQTRGAIRPALDLPRGMQRHGSSPAVITRQRIGRCIVGREIVLVAFLLRRNRPTRAAVAGRARAEVCLIRQSL